MSNDETGAGTATSAPLQFDRAEITTPAPSTCGVCSRALVEQYWTLNGKSVCGDCKNGLELHMRSPVPWRTWLAVLLRGGGTALLGTLLYFAVLKLTGYEFGIIAIVVGIMVGRAVLKASGGRRGWKFQLAAMALTYSSIVASYMPAVYSGLKEVIQKKHAAAAPSTPGAPPSATPSVAALPGSAPPPSAAPPSAAPPAPAPTSSAPQPVTDASKPTVYASHPILATALFVVILFVLAAVAPWMAGAHNILGLIIIGIALYEAWKINRRVPFVFAGPFAVSAAPPAATDAATTG